LDFGVNDIDSVFGYVYSDRIHTTLAQSLNQEIQSASGVKNILRLDGFDNLRGNLIEKNQPVFTALVLNTEIVREVKCIIEFRFVVCFNYELIETYG